MADSMVERPTVENKMGDSVPSVASLQVSVSFGRFEADSLSWEKWSSFSPNKYLEEVEKCSTPGSVAQKKAYFEAHYKKIAARKSEQLEQEKVMESVPANSDESDIRDPIKMRSVTNVANGLPANGRFAEGAEPEVEVMDKFNITPIDEEKEHDALALDCQELIVEEASEEPNGVLVDHELHALETNKEGSCSVQVEVCGQEEAIAVQHDNSKNSLDIVEQPAKVNKEAKKTPLSKKNTSKFDSGNSTPKVLTGMKKKAVSPALKSSAVTKMSQLSTPRLSKSIMMPPPLSSTKKVNGSSFPRAKNSSGQNRREMPTSLHMSLSLDPASSAPALSTTRKSLIMESMGDKDIVRRAFKTFQNSLNGLKPSNDGISNGSPQQVSMRSSEKKFATNLTPRKEKEGLRKSVEKIVQRGRPVNSSHPMPSWSAKGSGNDRKHSTVVSSSVRDDARAEKWKEKPGEKSFVREAEGAKAKEGEMKNVRQGIKPRASSAAPALSRGLGNTKITPEKEDKFMIHRRPLSKG